MTQNIFLEIPATKQSLSQRVLTFGVGVNDADYLVTAKSPDGKRVICPYYKVWRGMVERCYSSDLHKKRPTYIGCSVAKEWLIFSNFKKWMIAQDWQGMALDKDIKHIGNKVYSPDTCLFVTTEVNSLFTSCLKSRSELPVGVYFEKKTKKYRAACSVNGKQRIVGRFSSIEDAYNAYLKKKIDVVFAIANKKENKKIKNYLINYSILMKKDFSYE